MYPPDPSLRSYIRMCQKYPHPTLSPQITTIFNSRTASVYLQIFSRRIDFPPQLLAPLVVIVAVLFQLLEERSLLLQRLLLPPRHALFVLDRHVTETREGVHRVVQLLGMLFSAREE